FNFFTANINFYDQNGILVGNPSQNKLLVGVGINGNINYPIEKNIFLSGRFGYNYFSGDLDYLIFDYNTRQTTIVSDVVPTKIGYFEIMPGIQIYNLFSTAPYLYFLGGIEVGIIQTARYENKYLGVAEIDIPNTNTRVALVLGSGYTFKLSESVFLSPEATFRINLNKLTEYTKNQEREILSFSQLRIGASLTFGIQPSRSEEYYREEKINRIRIAQVRTYDDQGNMVPVDVLMVEDTKYQELFPLVPYVFFEQNSTSLQSGTQKLISNAEIGGFNINNLDMDALEINKRTLDIVGQRMKENPRSELTVTGTIDGSKIEQQNKQLALQRATFVKDYLSSVWGINPERINTRTTGLPSKPSSSNDSDGVAENRRAELSSSDPKILEPIFLEGKNQRIAQPNLIEFVPEIIVHDSISYWQLTVYQGNQILRQFSGSGMPKVFTWNIRPNELANRSVPIDYRLEVQLLGGEKLSANGSIPVDYVSYARKKTEDLPDKQISKFSLVLFDFDKAEVSTSDEAIIRKYIIPEIKYNSIVKIYGFTDRIGDDNYNIKLATRRAEAVKSIIQKQLKDVKIETYGVGERTLLFDNDISIGRHLCRTVQVVVITPR
ncbi:MAG: OmpA family protein, partial [Candidatus Kapaibacteriales bacterium]